MIFTGATEYCDCIDEDMRDAKYSTSVSSETFVFFPVNRTCLLVVGHMQFNYSFRLSVITMMLDHIITNCPECSLSQGGHFAENSQLLKFIFDVTMK